jgi:hypothetical protein
LCCGAQPADPCSQGFEGTTPENKKRGTTPENKKRGTAPENKKRVQHLKIKITNQPYKTLQQVSVC